jgi:hypothetical protein
MSRLCRSSKHNAERKMEELPGYAKVPWTVGGRYCLEVDAVVLSSGERKLVATISSARWGGDRARPQRDILMQRGASSPSLSGPYRGPPLHCPGRARWK